MKLEDRVMVYIKNVEQALSDIKKMGIKGEALEIVELAESYLKDSIHYAKVGDYETALATISYAEGLLDALRILKIVDIKWKSPSEIGRRATNKVFVAGTFDILHPGHIEYLKYAWSLGKVIAVVAHDETVRRIKGRDPIIPAVQRAEMVSALSYVHKARVGYPGDMYKIVVEERPNIVLLGPNQPFDESSVKKELERRGLEVEVVRMGHLRQCDLCSTSSIIRRILSMSSELSQYLNNGK